MSDQHTIEIPRLPEETARQYAARVEYLTMGAGRSFDRLLERIRSANGAHITNRRETLGAWSVRYNWQEHAARYDNALASLAAQSTSEQYIADVEKHRARYQKVGEDLYTASSALLAQCLRAIRGEVIEGADGKQYTIPRMELTPSTFATAIKGLQTAADFSAHALQLQQLIPNLSAPDDSQ